MATTKTNHTQAFGEQYFEAARKTGNLYLDAYEQAVDRTLDLERKLAGASRQDWLKDLIEAQTEISRELVTTYTSAARTLLK
jgi:Phasin protein